VKAGTEAAHFLFWEYINWIFIAVHIPFEIVLQRKILKSGDATNGFCFNELSPSTRKTILFCKCFKKTLIPYYFNLISYYGSETKSFNDPFVEF
jgi:hypothetical protein